MKIHLYGHVLAPTGYGHACRELAMSLLAAGLELEIFPLESGHLPDLPLATLLRRHGEHQFDADISIVHTLPMDCLALTQKADIGSAIAYTTWEGLSAIPEDMIAALATFEQIWTPSKASANGFLRGFADGGVKVIPHSYDPAAPAATFAPLGAPDCYGFYYVGAWTSRKNPLGLLLAWAMAFQPEEPVELNLHCAGAPEEIFAVALHQTGLLRKQMAPVRFNGVSMSPDRVAQMHTSLDCFVSAARGEAWNLPAFDAMLAGRNVIATGGLGSDDFLMDTSATLIGGMAQPATVDVARVGTRAGGLELQRVGAQGLTSRTTWLEPDLVRMSHAMRNAAYSKRRDLHRKYDPAERYSRQAVGKLCTHALEDL